MPKSPVYLLHWLEDHAKHLYRKPENSNRLQAGTAVHQLKLI